MHKQIVGGVVLAIACFAILFALHHFEPKPPEVDTWTCVEEETTLYSINQHGEIDGVTKGCSCEQIINFERDIYGSVGVGVGAGEFKSTYNCDLPPEN